MGNRTLRVDSEHDTFLDQHEEMNVSALFRDVLSVLIDIDKGTRPAQGEILSLAVANKLTI